MYIQGLNFPNFPRSDKIWLLQFPHYFQQAVDENTQTYQLEVILIFHQILATNIQGIV